MDAKLPRHRKNCAYKADPYQLCTCGVKVVGQPFTHWQKMARELVVESLLRDASSFDTRSVPGLLAHDQLVDLAHAVDASLVQELKGRL